MAGRLTVKGVADKLREYHGNQAAVARAFGVDRSRITQYMEQHPELRAVKQEAEEAILDHAESALYRAVLQGELAAVKWLLATKGKGRGYVERQEVTGSDGGELVVRVVYADVGIDTAAPTFGAADSHSGSAAV